jgi:hypothetical protein
MPSPTPTTPCQFHLDCQFLKDRLPDLYENDPKAQEEVSLRFLERHAQILTKIYGEEYGDQAALDGLHDFFERCRRRDRYGGLGKPPLGPYPDESHPYRILWRYTTNAAYRLVLADLPVHWLRLVEVAASEDGAAALVTVFDHGLSEKSRFRLSGTNSVPPIDADYGPPPADPFQVLDRNQFLVFKRIESPGKKGWLCVPRPGARGWGGPGDDGGDFDPPDWRIDPTSGGDSGIEPCLDELSERERDVVWLRCAGMTFEDIGDRYSISRERAGQIFRDAIEKLQRCFRRRGLMD